MRECGVMVAIMKVWRQVENPTARIDTRNDCTKFHPDLIWNDGALGFFEHGRPNKNKQKMMMMMISKVK